MLIAWFNLFTGAIYIWHPCICDTAGIQHEDAFISCPHLFCHQPRMVTSRKQHCSRCRHRQKRNNGGIGEAPLMMAQHVHYYCGAHSSRATKAVGSPWNTSRRICLMRFATATPTATYSPLRLRARRLCDNRTHHRVWPYGISESLESQISGWMGIRQRGSSCAPSS